MVQNEKPFSMNASRVKDFFQDSFLMAHHAAFDLGFIAYDFEQTHISFPENPVLCTSLLSQEIDSRV